MSPTVPPSRQRPQATLPMRGAIDLAALAQAREAQRQAAERAQERAAAPAGSADAIAGTVVIDVTEATFQSAALDRSFEVPVVIDLWATWCEPCKQLSPILERLAVADAGSWILAKVDVDAQPAISQAFRVQSIPTIVALVKGQPVPLFQGALPEADVRKIIDELIKVAAENGVSGNVLAAATATDSDDTAAAEEPGDDPRFDAAFEAFELGDWDAAEASYRQILADSPTDPDATAGVVRVELMRRTDGADQSAALAAANAAPGDVSAAKLAADFEILDGNARAAFARLIEAVKLTDGDARQAVRKHLVALFELVGSHDPDVAAARTALANALF
jgi:putative thioredoxin